MMFKWGHQFGTTLFLAEDSRLVTCKVYGEQVSREGANTKTFNTTNLVYHLKKHKEEFGCL